MKEIRMKTSMLEEAVEVVVAKVVITDVETIMMEVAEVTIVVVEEGRKMMDMDVMIVTMISIPCKPKQDQNMMKTRNTISA